jgi:hypothetical protein
LIEVGKEHFMSKVALLSGWIVLSWSIDARKWSLTRQKQQRLWRFDNTIGQR